MRAQFNFDQQLVTGERLITALALVLMFMAMLFYYAQPAQSSMGRSIIPAPTQASFASQAESQVSLPKFTICFVGDNNLGTYTQSIHVGIDPYKYIRPTLLTCDLLIGNLETNVAPAGTGIKQPKSYNFQAPPEAIDWLNSVGMDAVSLANNHSMDYGPEALLTELNLLDAGGIQHFGAGATIAEAFTAKYLYYHGATIALIGVNNTETDVSAVRYSRAGSAYFNAELLQNAITTAKQKSDIVIVYPHWGDENTTVVNSHQQYWAKAFIDWGADLVVGSGPHYRQGEEVYKDKHIYYSLGNFALCGFYFLPEGTVGRMLTVGVANGQLTDFRTQEIPISFLGLPYLREETPELYANDQIRTDIW